MTLPIHFSVGVISQALLGGSLVAQTANSIAVRIRYHNMKQAQHKFYIPRFLAAPIIAAQVPDRPATAALSRLSSAGFQDTCQALHHLLT